MRYLFFIIVVGLIIHFFPPIGELPMLALLLDLIALILAVIFIIPAFVYQDKRDFGTSAVWTMGTLAALCWYFWPDLKLIAEERGLVHAVLVTAGLYVAMGVATSFLYWIFFNFKAKERFERHFANTTPKFADPELSVAHRKYQVIIDDYQLRDIFDDPCNKLHIKVKRIDVNSTANEFNEAVAEVLPPKFATCKYFIIGAGIAWPITLIWLVAARIIRQTLERIINSFSSLFDKISVLTFGKF